MPLIIVIKVIEHLIQRPSSLLLGQTRMSQLRVNKEVTKLGIKIHPTLIKESAEVIINRRVSTVVRTK
jgi:hypothetical protein